MKKKILLFLVLFFISSSHVLAAGCVSSFSVNGSTRRANGHQSQWFDNGSYETTGGSVSSSCFTISGGGSIVKTRVSGTSFQFSPQTTGSASVTYTLSASCSCSKKSSSKTVVFTFSEWGLANLVVKGYTLSPSFSNMVMQYTITVPQNVNSVDLTITPNERNAKIKVNGTTVSAGNTTAQIVNNKIDIVVTTSVGDARTTTITVKRSAAVSSSSSVKPASCAFKTEEAAEEEAKIKCSNSYVISLDRTIMCYNYSCLPSGGSTSSKKSSSSSLKSSSSSTSSSKSSSSSSKSSAFIASKSSSPSSSSDDDNPETGSAEMFVIWILGVSAIGYSVWYYKNEKNNNLDAS